MTPQYALLGILATKPSYGYELKRRYDLLFGKGKSLAFGQVYATLARLLRDEKITVQSPTASEQVMGPERRQYAITLRGRQELEEWLKQTENAYSDAKPIIFAKVITSILLDANPYVSLDAQRAACIAHMRELTETRRRGDLLQALQADYALFHLEADLRWIDLASARVDKVTKEIGSER